MSQLPVIIGFSGSIYFQIFEERHHFFVFKQAQRGTAVTEDLFKGTGREKGGIHRTLRQIIIRERGEEQDQNDG